METSEIGEGVLARIQKVFHEVFDDDSLVLTRGTGSADVEGWDSMMHVNLVIAIEQEFGVRFNAKEMAAFQTVGDFEALIRARLGEA